MASFFVRRTGVNYAECGGKRLTKQEIHGILIKHQEIGNRPGIVGRKWGRAFCPALGRPVCEKLHGRSHFS